MSLTGSMRIMAAAGAVLLSGGLLVSVHGMIRTDVPRSLIGGSLVVIGVTMLALVAIRRWISDTSSERRDLAQARREAEAEHLTYVTAQAALESEKARRARDMDAERRRVAATLAAERKALLAEFEEQRLQLAIDAFRTGVEMERSGMLKPDQPITPANLIQFPKPEHEKPRERGVVQP